MRGYLSFVLVFLCAALLLASIPALREARSLDYSDSILIERAYGLEMNAKGCAIESVRQGAASGFDGYDASHSLDACIHCPDHFCTPPTPADPYPPNVCDAGECSSCFREKEAREAALAGAGHGLSLLRGHATDGMQAVFGAPGGECLEAFLVPDPLARNGLRVGSVRFCRSLPIRVSLKEGGDVSLDGMIPEGTVVR